MNAGVKMYFNYHIWQYSTEEEYPEAEFVLSVRRALQKLNKCTSEDKYEPVLSHWVVK